MINTAMFPSSVTYSHLLIGVLALPGVELTPAVKTNAGKLWKISYTVLPFLMLVKSWINKTFCNTRIMYLYKTYNDVCRPFLRQPPNWWGHPGTRWSWIVGLPVCRQIIIIHTCTVSSSQLTRNTFVPYSLFKYTNLLFIPNFSANFTFSDFSKIHSYHITV